LITILTVDPADPQTAYAGGFVKMFRSTDGGEHWSAVDPGLSKHFARTPSLDPSDPETIYIGTSSDGVIKFKAGGSD
jgi:photosystem II stability/assembly factor-like uncharacterized protein